MAVTSFEWGAGRRESWVMSSIDRSHTVSAEGQDRHVRSREKAAEDWSFI